MRAISLKVDEGPGRRVLVAGLACYAFLLRLVYAPRIELIPEETYYWNYSRHLDFGYLDHPPLVAWIIRLGTLLFGDTELGVRSGALCCGVIAACFVFRLARNVFAEPSALLAAALAAILPFFFLSGMLMTPDAPLTAAWAAALYFLERALCAGKPRAWIGAGLSLGLGLLAKYTIALVGVSALLFMLADPPSRRWFRRWEPYAALLIAGVLFAPVILWNAEHDWASFAFQTSRRLAERPRFALHTLLLSVMVLLTPTLFLAAVTAIASRGAPADRAAAAVAGHRARRFLRFAVLVPLAVFALFSLRHEVKLDWTGAPCVAVLPLTAWWLTGSGGDGSPGNGRRSSGAGLRAAGIPTLAVMMLIYTAGFYHLVSGLPGLPYSGHTELLPMEWRDLAARVDAIVLDVREKTGDRPLVVGMDRYAIASELAFYSHHQAEAVAATSSAHLFNDMGLMYGRWFPVGLQTGRTLLLVAFDPAQLNASHLEKRVERLGPVVAGVLARDGVIVRRYYYRVAYGYRPHGDD